MAVWVLKLLQTRREIERTTGRGGSDPGARDEGKCRNNFNKA